MVEDFFRGIEGSGLHGEQLDTWSDADFKLNDPSESCFRCPPFTEKPVLIVDVTVGEDDGTVCFTVWTRISAHGNRLATALAILLFAAEFLAS